jgi:hypothetical protein
MSRRSCSGDDGGIMKVKILVWRYTPEGEIVKGKEVEMDKEFALQLERQGIVEIIDKKKKEEIKKVK